MPAPKKKSGPLKTVALTGGIGSGKTTVLKLVRSGRVATVDCDRIVSGLYRQNPVKKRLEREFGSTNRKEIARIAFGSSQKRKRLEAILHPLVWKQLRERLASLKGRGKGLAFVEVPLLFEAKWENRFDFVVFVKASKKKRLERLAGKGIPKKQALARMRAQLPRKKRVKKSHYTIDNSGSQAQTRKLAKELLKKLLPQ